MRSLILFLALTSSAYAADLPIAVQVIACESAGQHMKHGRLNCNTHEPKGGRSCGVAQFQLATFKWMRRLAKMPWLKYSSEVDQLILFKWAMEHGKARHWSCYRMIQDGWGKELIMKNRLVIGVLE